MNTDDPSLLSAAELLRCLNELRAELDDLEAQRQLHERQTGLHSGLGEFRRQLRFFVRETERLRAQIAAIEALLVLRLGSTAAQGGDPPCET